MNFKHSFLFIGSLLLTFWLLISFSPKPKIVTSDIAVTSMLFYTVIDYPSQLKTSQPNTEIPFLDNSYVAFKEALAFKESQGKYGAVNTLGYLGKYQFGVSTLELLGIKNPRLFLILLHFKKKLF